MPKDDNRKEVKLWLEPEDHEKLANLATAHKRSIRSEVYYCILRGIREQEDSDLERIKSRRFSVSALAAAVPFDMPPEAE